MNFRTLMNFTILHLIPHWKSLNRRPFFCWGDIAALGRSWSPFAPKAQGGEAERERQLGDFGGFPLPLFLPRKCGWETGRADSVVFLGYSFLWKCGWCSGVFVESWNVIFCRLSRIYTCAWNRVGFYLEPLRDLGLHIKMRPLLFAERWKAYSTAVHSETTSVWHLIEPKSGNQHPNRLDPKAPKGKLGTTALSGSHSMIIRLPHPQKIRLPK